MSETLLSIQLAELTNGANDASPSVVLLGSIVNVQRRMPLHLGAVVEMIQSVTHVDDEVLILGWKMEGQ